MTRLSPLLLFLLLFGCASTPQPACWQKALFCATAWAPIAPVEVDVYQMAPHAMHAQARVWMDGGWRWVSFGQGECAVGQQEYASATVLRFSVREMVEYMGLFYPHLKGGTP